MTLARQFLRLDRHSRGLPSCVAGVRMFACRLVHVRMLALIRRSLIARGHRSLTARIECAIAHGSFLAAVCLCIRNCESAIADGFAAVSSLHRLRLRSSSFVGLACGYARDNGFGLVTTRHTCARIRAGSLSALIDQKTSPKNSRGSSDSPQLLFFWHCPKEKKQKKRLVVWWP